METPDPVENIRALKILADEAKETLEVQQNTLSTFRPGEKAITTSDKETRDVVTTLKADIEKAVLNIAEFEVKLNSLRNEVVSNRSLQGGSQPAALASQQQLVAEVEKMRAQQSAATPSLVSGATTLLSTRLQLQSRKIQNLRRSVTRSMVNSTGQHVETVVLPSAEIEKLTQDILDTTQALFKEITAVYYETGQANVNPVSRRRRSSMPIPQVLLEEIIGREELVEIALKFQTAYRGNMVAWHESPDGSAPRIHLADVRHYLQANLEGAWRMVASPEHRNLLVQMIEPGECPSGLAGEIVQGRLDSVKCQRKKFHTHFSPSNVDYHATNYQQISSGQTASIMQSLAWPVIVEMALLNDQLNKDVHDIAATRGDCGCHPSQRHAYYLPASAI